MAEVHVLRPDPALLRLDQLTVLLAEWFHDGVDLGPRGIQIAALRRNIERDVGKALEQVEQVSASASPDHPARSQLGSLLETLRRMILTLEVQAKSLSPIAYVLDRTQDARHE